MQQSFQYFDRMRHRLQQEAQVKIAKAWRFYLAQKQEQEEAERNERL